MFIAKATRFCGTSPTALAVMVGQVLIAKATRFWGTSPTALAVMVGQVLIIWRKQMAFIGIIADSKYESGLKRILENRLNIPNKEHTIITINDKSIDNIKNIRFETILIMNLNKVEEKKEILNELFKNSKYLVINADMESKLELAEDIKLNVITFGFNSKSTITASSVEESFIICLQRNIIDIDSEILEPQEIKVKMLDKKLSNNSHNLMGIASILLIYGKKENFL